MKGPPLTDPAAFLTPTDQLLPLVAYFGKAMAAEVRARRGLPGGR
jgi:hypothetical protein